jgi:hypothetical protein
MGSVGTGHRVGPAGRSAADRRRCVLMSRD